MKLTKSPRLDAFGVGPVESLDLATPTFAANEGVPQQSGSCVGVSAVTSLA